MAPETADAAEVFDLVISDARVFDGQDWLPTRKSIGINDKRIAAIADRPLAGRRTIDASRAYALPGLIDAHIHLFDFTVARSPDTLAAFVRDALPARLRAFLQHGVTTIKSVGDPTAESIATRQRIASGELIGPRLFATGLGITAPDGHPAATVYRLNPWYRARATGEVDTTDAARSLVAQLAEAGVDAIKLLSQGRCACSTGEPYYWKSKVSGATVAITRIRSKVLDAAIDEAHRHRLKVTVHTYDLVPAIQALEAGADGLEHGVVSERLGDGRFLELMRQKGASYVPTLWIYPYDDNARSLKDIADAGLHIALGTDSFSGHGAFGANTLVEAERMVAAGMPPIAVLRAGTSAAARHLGQPDIGMIGVGKLADIIVVDDDPMASIGNLRSLRATIADGAIVFERGRRDD